MPDEWTEGLIYMIPKTDARCDEISKRRPITLLNDIYKIVAKTTTNRMRPLLPSIIHDTQSGFLQDWSIFDNIFLFWEMTALAQHHKQSLAILLLDFEKAYDKVDWDFLVEKKVGNGGEIVGVEAYVLVFEEEVLKA